MLKNIRFLIIMSILLFSYLPAFTKLQELKQRLKETQAETLKVKQENLDLEEKIKQMRTNPDYLAVVARDKMGVVKKGETVIKIVRQQDEDVFSQDSI
ncbi:MAG: septum formation initiator family protein [Candidatus Omnitrophota bacterium]